MLDRSGKDRDPTGSQPPVLPVEGRTRPRDSTRAPFAPRTTHEPRICELSVKGDISLRLASAIAYL